MQHTIKSLRRKPALKSNKAQAVVFVERGAYKRRQLAFEKSLLLQAELGMSTPLKLVKP